MYTFETEQFLPVSIHEAWRFFSSPQNLSLITPPELGFKIISRVDNSQIFEGLKIEYMVKPFLGIPVKWITEIGETIVHRSFVDKQIKGPYKKWEHKHIFMEHPGGILMKDIINYEVPFGMIGDIAHRLFVRKKIEAIFRYREAVLNTMFPLKNRNSYFDFTELQLN